MPTVTSDTNGLVMKEYYNQRMQSINLISEEIAKIKIKNNVCIDFDYTDNSFGTARFYLFKTNTGERKCIRLFGYTEPNSGATINNTKFYYDAEG